MLCPVYKASTAVEDIDKLAVVLLPAEVAFQSLFAEGTVVEACPLDVSCPEGDTPTVMLGSMELVVRLSPLV